MAVSYNGLWKLLIDKGMKKMDLVEQDNIGIRSGTLAKMGQGEIVSLAILDQLCDELDCDFGDIISHIKNDKEQEETDNEKEK